MTVEVKRNVVNWRSLIFEAIAHKRKSDRVYFLFRSKGEGIAELSEMVQYAEKYRIGLVEFELPTEEEQKVMDWVNRTEAEKLNFSEYFVEHVPAPLDPISIRDKIAFLRQRGIKSRGDIYEFGLGT